MATKTIQINETITYKKRILTCERTQFDANELLEVFILTADNFPFDDDVVLVLAFERDTLIIPSEHPKFREFLFDSLAKDFPINYSRFIESMSCTDNEKFVLWKKPT